MSTTNPFAIDLTTVRRYHEDLARLAERQHLRRELQRRRRPSG
jgi:hypothetical protein